MVRKWQASGRWSGPLACARIFAGRMRRGSVVQTKQSENKITEIQEEVMETEE